MSRFTFYSCWYYDNTQVLEQDFECRHCSQCTIVLKGSGLHCRPCLSLCSTFDPPSQNDLSAAWIKFNQQRRWIKRISSNSVWIHKRHFPSQVRFHTTTLNKVKSPVRRVNFNKPSGSFCNQPLLFPSLIHSSQSRNCWKEGAYAHLKHRSVQIPTFALIKAKKLSSEIVYRYEVAETEAKLADCNRSGCCLMRWLNYFMSDSPLSYSLSHFLSLYSL